MQWKYSHGRDDHGFGYSWDGEGTVEGDSAEEALKAAVFKECEWIPWEEWERSWDEDSVEHYTKDHDRYWIKLEEANEH
jgi:hypothetical protein